MIEIVEYQEMEFPVDYGRKVLGSLTDEEVRRYSMGVNERREDNSEGHFNRIFFERDNAIRYLREKAIPEISVLELIKKKGINRSLKNFFIGNHLIEEDIGAPKMKAVYWGSQSNIPFLVMEKLNFRRFEFGINGEFGNQFRKIKSLGYDPIDSYYKSNLGIERSFGYLCFFDFDAWEREDNVQIPQLNSEGRIE